MAAQRFAVDPTVLQNLWDRDHSRVPFDLNNYMHVQYAINEWVKNHQPNFVSGFWTGNFIPDDNLRRSVEVIAVS